MKRWFYLVALLVTTGLTTAAFIYECGSIDTPFSEANQNDAFESASAALDAFSAGTAGLSVFHDWNTRTSVSQDGRLIPCEALNTTEGFLLSGQANELLLAFYSPGLNGGFGLNTDQFETAACLPLTMLFEACEPADLIAVPLPYTQKMTVDNILLWGAMITIN